MKIWLKNPDPDHKCCGCEGKIGPCSSCSKCNYSGIYPSIDLYDWWGQTQFFSVSVLDIAYRISNYRGYSYSSTGAGDCTICNNIAPFQPTKYSISDFYTPRTRAYTSASFYYPYAFGVAPFAIIDCADKLQIYSEMVYVILDNKKIVINYTVSSSASNGLQITANAPQMGDTNFMFVTPVYSGDVFNMSNPNYYLQGLIVKTDTGNKNDMAGNPTWLSVGGDGDLQMWRTTYPNQEAFVGDNGGGSYSVTFNGNYCVEFIFDTSNTSTITITDRSGHMQNPLERFDTIPSGGVFGWPGPACY